MIAATLIRKANVTPLSKTFTLLKVHSYSVTVDISETGRKRLVVCQQNFTSYQLPSSSLRQQQTTRSFETSVTGYPGTQHHIPEDRNSLFHRCEKLRTRKFNHITRSIYLRRRATHHRKNRNDGCNFTTTWKTSSLIFINMQRVSFYRWRQYCSCHRMLWRVQDFSAIMVTCCGER